jgi:very-short-patch-repair endonuclease
MKYQDLTDNKKKQLIIKEHIQNQKSILQIAKENETYPNKILRDAKKYGLKTRNKSEAQKIALKTGIAKHPTKNQMRKEEEKRKIGNSVSRAWSKISKSEKERRKNLAKKNWNKRSQKQIRNMKEKSIQGILKAAKYGSKLEKYIRDKLINDEFEFEYHVKHIVSNEDMHIDILLKDPIIAIEIDGPMHYKQVWDDEILHKNKERDKKKNGLLLNEGISVIRIKSGKKNFSFSHGDKVYQELLKQIKKINKDKPKISYIGE